MFNFQNVTIRYCTSDILASFLDIFFCKFRYQWDIRHYLRHMLRHWKCWSIYQPAQKIQAMGINFYVSAYVWPLLLAPRVDITEELGVKRSQSIWTIYCTQYMHEMYYFVPQNLVIQKLNFVVEMYASFECPKIA